MSDTAKIIGAVNETKDNTMTKRILSKFFLIVYLIFLVGCVSHYTISNDLPDSVMAQMNVLYPRWHEISYCVGDEVYNILEGGITSCPLPLCNFGDIVFHTHPIWAENFANFYDKWNFDIYHCVFGNTKFGVMYGVGQVKIYERKPEYIGFPVVASIEDIERIRRLNNVK